MYAIARKVPRADASFATHLILGSAKLAMQNDHRTVRRFRVRDHDRRCTCVLMHMAKPRSFVQAWLTPVPPSIQVPVRNRILTKLAPTEHQRLRSSLMQVELHENQVLFAPGDPVSHVYFPNDGVVSLPVDVDERRAVEVAMEGNEGAVGLATYLDGVQSCNLAVVRNARTAMRMEVNALEERAVGPGDCRSCYAGTSTPWSHTSRSPAFAIDSTVSTRAWLAGY